MNVPLAGTKASRITAIAILVAVCVVPIIAIAVPAYLLHRRYDTADEAFRNRLAHFQQVAAQHQEYSRALKAVNAKNGRRFFLKATATNLAGAELQELVRVAVEGGGGRLGSIHIGQPREEDKHRLMMVSVQLVANVKSLQRILHELEAQTPFLFVDNMSLRTSVFRGFRPTPGVEPEINVQMDVSAYIVGSPN